MLKAGASSGNRREPAARHVVAEVEVDGGGAGEPEHQPGEPGTW